MGRYLSFSFEGSYFLAGRFFEETGDPGTILTFFPWQEIQQGRRGTGQATETAFSVPSGSFDFWIRRFEKENIIYNKPAKRLSEEYLTFIDPDGLKLELVAVDHDERKPYTGGKIGAQHAVRGFYNVTLSLEGYEKTARLLTELFGFQLTAEVVNRYRFESGAAEGAAIIDLVCLPDGHRGHVAGGTVHHVAFRVKDNEEQLYFRAQLANLGYNVTPLIDRDYFMSIYFREPGGVLFEIATDPPGFTADEPLEALGSGLKLPVMYEPRRAEIEKVLPVLG